MTLEMRELKGDDLFVLLSIIGKLDIKEDFVKIFEQNIDDGMKPQDHKKKEPTKAELLKREKEEQKRGMEAMASLLQTVMLNISKVRDDINSLLADLCGVTVKEIKDLNFKEYTALIIAFFKKEELKDFFSSIASLL